MDEVIVQEPMVFDRQGEYGRLGCSACQLSFVKLCKYGLCASCWSRLPQEMRDALHPRLRVVTREVRVEVQRVVEQNWRWRPSGLLLMAASVALAVAFSVATTYLLLRHVGLVR